MCNNYSASIGISFVLFVGISSYHAFLRMSKTKYYNVVKLHCLNRFFNKWRLRSSETRQDQSTLHEMNASSKSGNQPSTSSVDLREELLATSYN